MSKSAIAVRHVHFEDLGVFESVLRRYRYAVGYCDAGIDDVGSVDPLAHDLVIVLGGPIGAYEETTYPFLAQEIALLKRRLAAARPTIGICLGAQLMARALGARVYPARAKKIGWAELQLSESGRTGGVAPFNRRAGSTLAWRHLRPAGWGRASRLDRDLPKSGV